MSKVSTSHTKLLSLQFKTDSAKHVLQMVDYLTNLDLIRAGLYLEFFGSFESNVDPSKLDRTNLYGYPQGVVIEQHYASNLNETYRRTNGNFRIVYNKFEILLGG